MRNHLPAAALASFAVVIAACQGDDRPAAPSVPELIERLGSADFRVREEAGRLLKARGAAALPALRRAGEHGDAEVRRRAAELLPIVEKAVALKENAAALEPTRVTLDLTDRPIRDAVADLARQTGYTIRIDPQARQDDRRHSFHLKDVTFWEAVEKVCAAGGLQPAYRPVSEGTSRAPVVLVPRSGRASPAAHNGPFRVSVLGMTEASRRPQITLAMTPEPKLALLLLEVPILSVADSDQKKSLLPPPPAYRERPDNTSRRYGWGNPLYQHACLITLQAPAEKARTLKSLQGTIPVLLLAGRKPLISIDRILSVKDKTFEADQTVWHIDEVAQELEPGSRRYRVKMSIQDRREAVHSDMDHSWADSLSYRIVLQDAKGNAYEIATFPSWDKPSPWSAKGTLVFSPPEGGEIGPPARLVYYRWRTVRHRVDFAFHDLPLP